MSGTVGTPSGNRSIVDIQIGGVGPVFQGWIGTAGGNRLVFGESVTLPAGIFVSDNFGGVTPFVEIVFTSTGDILTSNSNFPTEDGGDWVAPKADAPGAYQIRATRLAGDFPIFGSGLGSFLPLSSNRGWGLNAGPPGTLREVDLLIEISLASVVLDSCVVFLSVTNGGIDPA